MTSNGSDKKITKNKGKLKQIISWLGLTATAITVIATTKQLFWGDKGIIETIKPDQCSIKKFEAQNYKTANNAFFQEFDSQKALKIPLWEQDGSPRPLGEVLISRSKKLTSLRQAIINQKAYSPKRLILIYGSAGAGKSVIVKSLNSGKSVVLIDLSKIRYDSIENKIHPMTQLVTDLKIGEIEVSKMADILPKEKEKRFIQLLNDIGNTKVQNKKSIIIDGIDELHPFSSAHILSLADKYLAQNPTKNIIIVGRGEGFRGYIEKYRDTASYEDIYLEPIYLNTAELRRWYITQYLTFTQSRNNPKDVFQEINNIIKQKPELDHFLQTTEPANLLLLNREYDIDKLSELEFLDLMKRNKRTHNRPFPDAKSEAGELYEQALIQASRSLKPQKLADGRVTALVTAGQKINIKHGEKCISVELSKVLDRSGVASLNPFKQNQLEYIFQPVTIQKFMAERENFSDIQKK